MGLFRKSGTGSVERPTLLLKIKLANKKGEPLDEQEAWQALVDCFRNHPTLEVFQAEVIPDYDS